MVWVDRTNRRRAFTLIELLVAVAILVIMMLIFGQVLSSAKTLVNTAQANMRYNATTAAIAQVIRRDFQTLSQAGFLAVAEDVNGNDRLIFSAVEPARSIMNPTADTGQGIGRIVNYGIVRNFASDDSEQKILWRLPMLLQERTSIDGNLGSGDDIWEMRYLFNPPGASGSYARDSDEDDMITPDWTDDPLIPIAYDKRITRFRLDMATMQMYPRDKLRDHIIRRLIHDVAEWHGDEDHRLYIPIQKADQAERIWQILTIGCTDLQVRWTDGSSSGGGLRWYGPDQAKGDSNIETSVNGRYVALWTHENQSRWPKAIRLRFRLKDNEMPEEFRDGLWYELVCSVVGRQ
jgi:prepilin-type N-terminal cleavage/methylation domain-containing protein